MKTRAVAGWSAVLGGAALGLAIAPTRAQSPVPGRAEEVWRSVARVRMSEEDYALRRRGAMLELEVLEARVAFKKAEIARADAEFRLGKIGPDLAILAQLDRPIPIRFPGGVSLEDLSRFLRESTKGAELPDGLPIYFDPEGLQEEDKTLASKVSMDLEGIPLRTTLRLLLRQAGLTYTVKDGLMTITSQEAADEPVNPPR